MTPTTLYGWYKNTHLFRQLYNEATYHLRSTKLSEDELRKFEGRIAGRIFEDIANEIVEFDHGKTKHNDSVRFLCGQQTLRLFMKMFPQTGRTFNLFKQDALTFINVPDFVTLENIDYPRVKSTGEITIRNSTVGIQYKIRSFQARRKQFPQLFVDYPRLHLVVPQDFEMNFLPGFVDITRLPFTRGEFRENISQALLDYRTPSLRMGIEFKRRSLDRNST